MRKTFGILSMLFILSVTSPSQEVFLTSNGIASFTSDAPLEVIKASTEQLQGALNLSDRSFIFSIDNKSFKGFNSSLQQEHFYENYMEVRKYPKSIFQGKIIEEIDLHSAGEQVVRAKGSLDIHGIIQERIIKGTLEISGDRIIIQADFTVPLEDHNIKIPRIVYQKIAEIVEVSIHAELNKKSE